MGRSRFAFGLLIFWVVAVFAFRPAPPPGSPSFVIDPAVSIGYVYIDAVVLDSVAQVVFFASLTLPDTVDEIEITPNWPIDSVIAYTSMNISKDEKGFLLQRGKTMTITPPNRTFVLRISYEVSVRRALTGPPGPWSFGKLFAIYPPFEGADGNPLIPASFRARLILPLDMVPISCASDFSEDGLLGGFKVWQYRGVFPKRICRFQSVQK